MLLITTFLMLMIRWLQSGSSSSSQCASGTENSPRELKISSTPAVASRICRMARGVNFKVSPVDEVRVIGVIASVTMPT